MKKISSGGYEVKRRQEAERKCDKSLFLWSEQGNFGVDYGSPLTTRKTINNLIVCFGNVLCFSSGNEGGILKHALINKGVESATRATQ